MSPRIKFGLIAGGIGLVLNICVAAVMGVCGPGVAAVAGALAGYFAAKNERPLSQGEGAKSGAIAGLIAGGLVLIGQILGGITTLTLMPAISEAMNISLGVETGDPIYWAAGLSTAACFSAVGIVLAVGAGAGTGYISTPAAASQPPAAD